MALESPITAEHGWFTNTDHGFVFTVYQADGVSVQDITGWSLSWMVKKKKTDTDVSALINKTTAAGIALTTPSSGVATVTVTDDDTVSLKDGTFYHELKRTTTGAEVVLAFGTARLQKSLHAS